MRVPFRAGVAGAFKSRWMLGKVGRLFSVGLRSNEVFEGVKTRQHGAEREGRPDDDGENVAQPFEEA
jgi:hypothetical protein